MTPEWKESKKYEPAPLSDDQRAARAHRLAAERNPLKRAAHLLSASLLTKAPDSVQAPSDDYEARVAAWKHVGGDWNKLAKSKG